MANVEIWPKESKGEGLDEPRPVSYEGIHKILWVNNETYGEVKQGDGFVLYVNPSNIIAMEIEK